MSEQASESAASQRVRFSGNVPELKRVLSKHIVAAGWLTYGKDDIHVNGQEITDRWAPLVRDLYELQPNMSFKKSDVKGALGEIAKTKNWKLSKSDLKEMQTVVANRLGLLCRHTSQAAKRVPQPKWFVSLMTTVAGPDPDTHAEQANRPRAHDSQTEFNFGWDPEYKRAWRAPAHDADNLEFAEPLLVPCGDDKPPMAQWADGMQHPVDQLAGAEWAVHRDDHDEKKRRSKCRVFLSRGVDKSGTEVIVKERSDRRQLVSMYIGGQQKCQIVVDDSMKSDAAGQVMTSIAEQFVAGTLSANDLYKERDLRMDALGFARPVQRPAGCERPLKRPATDDSKVVPLSAAVPVSSVVDALSSDEDVSMPAPPSEGLFEIGQRLASLSR